MHNVWAKKQGFTIIELLVVMVVIGILVTIMIVSYTGIQQRARDSERSSDVTQIRVALDKYRADQSSYPDVCSGGDNVECSVTSLATVLSPYLKTIPHDPRNVLDSAMDYRYIRGPIVDDSYAIFVSYEAKPACKIGHTVDSTWWAATIPSC